MKPVTAFLLPSWLCWLLLLQFVVVRQAVGFSSSVSTWSLLSWTSHQAKATSAFCQQQRFSSAARCTTSSTRRCLNGANDESLSLVVVVDQDDDMTRSVLNATETNDFDFPSDKEPRALAPAEQNFSFPDSRTKSDSRSLSAAELQDESDTAPVPTYRQLSVFTGTTILIWLSEPLLSLVDTTVVAWTQREAAVVQLAALGPATTLYDSLTYGTFFLAISTTNLVAKYMAVKDYRQLQETTRQILGVAAVLGCMVMAIVAFSGAPLLAKMAGSAASPELLHHAVRYTYIRATVAIASVWTMVSQSLLLATLDTVTPARAVVAASVINIIGDLLLSPKWGVQGAAVATAAATAASMAILLRAVRKQLKVWRDLEQEEQEVPSRIQEHGNLDSTATNSKTAVEKSSARKERSPSLLALPGRRDFLRLVTLAGPILFVIWAKVACYSGMTLKCTQFGVLSMATQAIMMRIFFFFSCFGDSVAQAAQSFLPSTLYPKPNLPKFRQVFKKLFVIAATIGVVNSQVSVWILKHLGKYLTDNSQIIQLMREQTSCVGGALLLQPIVIMLEGTVIAARDFKTLVGTYLITLLLHFGLLSQVQSFSGVWRTLLLYQGIRLGNFSIRVWKRQRELRQKAWREEEEVRNRPIAATPEVAC